MRNDRRAPVRLPVHRPWRVLAAGLVVSALSGVLSSALVLPAAAAMGAAVTAGNDLFDTLPANLPAGSVPATSVMLAADGTPMAYFYAENRSEIPLSRMAPAMQHAIVAVEDARFYEHGALDVRGVARAVVSDTGGGDTQGASTLTQQYVKNVLLEQATASGDSVAAQAATERSVSRKLRELRLAIGVESTLSKQQILERYLNIVYFGQQAYGVQAAAKRYFGVDAADLTLPQAALLAGLVQDPSGYDPVRHPQAAKARRDVVLTAMRDQGLVSSTEYTAALAAPVGLRGSVLPNGCI